jgi:hypothetical protein
MAVQQDTLTYVCVASGQLLSTFSIGSITRGNEIAFLGGLVGQLKVVRYQASC